MKKILFVDNSLSSFINFRKDIVISLIAEGYEIFLLCPKSDNIVDIDSINKIGIKSASYYLPKGNNVFNEFKLFWELLKYYKSVRPDFIIHYTIKPNIYGSIASRVLGIKSLSVIPGLGIAFNGKGMISYLIKKMYKLALNYPIKTWVLNKDDYTSLLNNKIIRQYKLGILPGEGVDVKYYKSEKSYSKSEPFTFLFIGRIMRAKGVEILIKAASILKNKNELPEIKVILLGGIGGGLADDAISESIIKEWEKKGIIQWIGQVNDVRKYIEDCQCVILPSFYGEGLPRSLMEAASMKRPIVTTDNVGCREVVVDSYNGLLCQPKNVESLANKMEEILSYTEERLTDMGEKGRLMMKQKFRKEIIIERYKEIIKRHI